MVVDEQLTAVGQRYRVGTCVGVGQIGRGDLAPCLAAIFGPTGCDHFLFAATQDLHPPIGVSQDTWLDRIEFTCVIDRPNHFPRFAEVTRQFEVDSPSVMLGAGGTQDRAVG